jgi:cobalt-zinc-cadmium resistance protein CzcA
MGRRVQNQQRAEARFRLILALVLGLMIVLLFAEFGVLRQTLLILGVVPLATLGGLIALHLSGENLNVASGVGFIALFGVSVMNGVIMVANLNRVRDLGGALIDAVLTGASERLRPVLMTAAVATVGMLPAALATGVGSDVQRSLATVVAGGLIPATLLTLFIIPTLYFVIERWAHNVSARPGRRPKRSAGRPDGCHAAVYAASLARAPLPPDCRRSDAAVDLVYQTEKPGLAMLCALVYFVMQS